MIDGIIILSEEIYYQRSFVEVICCIIFLGLISLAEIYFCGKLYKIYRSTKKWYLKLVSILVPIVCIALTFWCVNDVYQQSKISRLYYVIKVDDNVGFNEFNDTFNIIETYEDSYKVELKEID